VSVIKVVRPKVRTVCAHCKRKRAPQFIEWHPGIDEWQCSDFPDCDRAQDKRERKTGGAS
jgi:hypothetical protein